MTYAGNGQAGCMMRPVRPTPFHPAQDLAALVRLRSDLRAEGLSDNQITRLVRSGVLHRVRHGTYVAGEIWNGCSVEDRHRLLSRGVLARAHPSTVLTHVSSVVERGIPMWGLDMGVVHTTRGQSDRAGRHARDWTPHRGVLADEDIEVVNGVPVSTAARAAFEVMTVAAVEPALVVVNRLLHAGQLTLPALADQVDQHQRWPGSLTADLVLRLADPRLESVGEDRFIYLVYRQGLPTPRPAGRGLRRVGQRSSRGWTSRGPSSGCSSSSTVGRSTSATDCPARASRTTSCARRRAPNWCAC